MNALLTRIARRMSRPTPNVPAPDCEHVNASGVDDRTDDSPLKIWRCETCGYLFRYVLDAKRPWLFVDVIPADAA